MAEWILVLIYANMSGAISHIDRFSSYEQCHEAQSRIMQLQTGVQAVCVIRTPSSGRDSK